MQGLLTIFSGNSNPALAQRVCTLLDSAGGRALVGRFSDGEVRIEIHENVRGLDTYVIQSLCPPVNENLLELLIMVDALKRASARRINVVIPYYGYGRQDEKDKPRVSITARLVADLMAVAGIDRVIAIDLHADQIQGFFNIPVDHLYGIKELSKDAEELTRGEHVVVVAPDSGGVERARTFARWLNADLAIMDYRGTESSPGSHIVGNVASRRVIILDDMVDTGKTLLRAAESAEAAGAASIEACCVHAVLSGNAVESLDRSPLRSLTVTDTIPLSRRAIQTEKIRVVTIAPMLAEVIRRVHYEMSVSSLFIKETST